MRYCKCVNTQKNNLPMGYTGNFFTAGVTVMQEGFELVQLPEGELDHLAI